MGNGDEQFRLGEAARRRGDLKGAREQYLAAVKAEPDHVDAGFRLAELTVEDGDEDLAARLVKRVLELDPDHLEASRLRHRLGDDVEAPGDATVEQPPYAPIGDGLVGRVLVAARTRRPMQGRMGQWEVLTVRARPVGTLDGHQLSFELLGRSIAGDLLQGDWVELPDAWRPGDKVSAVVNLTSGQEVRAKVWTPVHIFETVAASIVVALIIGIFVFVGANLFEGRP